MLPPHSLATTYSNNELFVMLQRGAGGREYLRQCYILTKPEFEARRVAGLRVDIQPDAHDLNAYVITIRNRARDSYEDIHLKYETLLLNADNFGLDSTHMPSDVAQKKGEALHIASLAPGKTVQVKRLGYGPHEQYAGPAEIPIDLDFWQDGRQFSWEDCRWVLAEVKLPHARNIEKYSESNKLRHWWLIACGLLLAVYWFLR